MVPPLLQAMILRKLRRRFMIVSVFKAALEALELLRLLRLQNPYVNLQKGEQVEGLLYREKRDIEDLDARVEESVRALMDQFVMAVRISGRIAWRAFQTEIGKVPSPGAKDGRMASRAFLPLFRETSEVVRGNVRY
ncbi:hypothetical protein EV426DRAFT_713981 [Tirmania nivea]|nr:hypothetical protein EV426DRAFT_713981 [Tirmania nivea]